MKILHLDHTSQPGGAELALLRLLNRGQAWTATVMTLGSAGVFATLTATGIPVETPTPTLPTGGTSSRNVRRQLAYITALMKHSHLLYRSERFRQADLIHANTAAAAILAAPAVAMARIPLIIHIRDIVSPASLGRLGFEAFTKLAIPRASAIIANSQATLTSVAPFITDALPKIVLQSPIGMSDRVHTAPRRHVRKIGMIGRLQQWKGQHIFLKAFASTCNDLNVRAIIAGGPLFGETDYEQQLISLARQLRIDDRVDFLGHVEDVEYLIDSLDVVVHASITPEPMGQTVLQALAMGKPVVATEGGGPSEWLISGTNGILVRPNDPVSLSESLRALTDSYDLRQHISQGAAETRVMTDAECIRRHHEFFRHVLSLHKVTRVPNEK
ncbi:glycosyltransferase family 4 protein [Planosporangium thailandense]|uniref:Glycosyltransferase family 4 protein n=1 Tax=Planosporangium thailandense TaxID=765197 RepID=A0ABX0Y0I8_9ACTN|nr:glycosyltransferase family 4 protein [Planosporangium thailandense]NJC70974.1 glycosyltransferase family 4 protein [Planosporangium thailandense]